MLQCDSDHISAINIPSTVIEVTFGYKILVFRKPHSTVTTYEVWDEVGLYFNYFYPR